MTALLDTGFLLAVMSPNNHWHEACSAASDSKIDFMDCAVVAVAERLNISRILTVDQRDFRILRPKHIPAFEILP